MSTISGINGASSAHSLSFRSLGYTGMARHEMPSHSVFGVSLSPPSQAPHQQADHGHLDQGFAGLHFALIVHHQPPVTKQTGECTFEDPVTTPIARFVLVMRSVLSCGRFQ
jgi:hypothetical protein